jgi:hypothetical protein
MSVNSLAIDTGPSIYYDPSFRNVLEDHWSVLRNSGNLNRWHNENCRGIK